MSECFSSNMKDASNVNKDTRATLPETATMGSPDVAMYWELMEKIMLMYKCQADRNTERQNMAPAPKKSGKLVSTITSSSHIESVDNESDKSMPIGAVMPSRVLGSGSETEDDEVCIPLTSQHYQWTGMVTGPNTDLPVAVNTMLDCGTHVVLIHPSLVEQLGLHCFCLFKPLPVSVAIEEGKMEEKHLHEYVKLALSSQDSVWTLNTIKDIIAPNLHVPVLLGTMFLKLNHIMMDFEVGMAVDKHCEYDLLNPPVIKHQVLVDPKVVKKQLKHDMKEMKKHKKFMMKELIDMCKKRLAEGKCVPEEVKPLNMASMIHDCIMVLLMKKKLDRLQEAIMK